MIVAIINQKSEVAFSESILSRSAKINLDVTSLSGRSLKSFILESKVQWQSTVDRCLSSGLEQKCEVCLCLNGRESRWRMHLFRLNAGSLVVVGTSLPLQLPLLSGREMEVLCEISRGRSTVEIAEFLGISLSTVEKHRSRIRKTLRIDSHSQLVLVASLVANLDRFYLSIEDSPQ